METPIHSFGFTFFAQADPRDDGWTSRVDVVTGIGQIRRFRTQRIFHSRAEAAEEAARKVRELELILRSMLLRGR